jgi:AmmeMemoRadiSam system protein B
MKTRKPVVAGQFYPASRQSCLADIQRCIESGTLGADLPSTVLAGIVPHAGWTFSGPTAALVFSAIKQRSYNITTFIICGACHGYFGPRPAVDDHDQWETPLGHIAIDTHLRDALVQDGLVKVEPAAHHQEHSIEVQVPFIQFLFPEAKILPILVPPTATPVEFGERLAERVSASKSHVAYIGSTDLTHYGPRYGFTPMGAGPEGLRWASEVNDRRFIDLAVRLEATELLVGAMDNGYACGPGAAAAVVSAAQKAGAGRGFLLAYTTSNEILLKEMGTISRESVGYVAIVFGPS